MLTLLTATGCRPEAWALCERWMMAQTYVGPVRWIVVDDGKEAQRIRFVRDGWTILIVRPEPFWTAGMNSQSRNLLAGLAVVRPDERLAVIEDDDHYAPGYLEAVESWLDRAELVGECRARYYNTRTKMARQLGNKGHASLCSTAMKGNALQAFRAACRLNAQFIDLNLWREYRGSKMLKETSHVVGIKGLPGRGGIGVGHRGDFQGTRDFDGSILREWIGSDAEFYQ